MSADQPAADKFVSFFQGFIEENRYNIPLIFNCDETGPFKLMPQKKNPLASSSEKCADSRKTQKKERVLSMHVLMHLVASKCHY